MNNGDTLDRTTLSLPLALSGGAHATLGDFAGQWLVLYFYPKDSTPGCTTEGLDFNALLHLSPSVYWRAQDEEQVVRLFAATMAVLLMPKVLGYLAMLLDPVERRGCGGAIRAFLSMLVETVLAALMAPVVMARLDPVPRVRCLPLAKLKAAKVIAPVEVPPLALRQALAEGH